MSEKDLIKTDIESLNKAYDLIMAGLKELTDVDDISEEHYEKLLRNAEELYELKLKEEIKLSRVEELEDE